ncbi:MAG: hypothetical protein IT374_11120 [Polyangiaceae bacterium]|nr:hypothetical protein [Polyangiaceae bacterium]
MRLSSSAGLAITALSILGGCGTSTGVGLAERGDYAGLRRYVEAHQRKLDGGEVRDIAHAVVARTLKDTKPEDASARLDLLQGCLKKVDDVVERRAKTRDDAGAHAAFLLVDGGVVSPGGYREEAGSDDAGWRAVGARTLFRERDGARRRGLFVDLDVRVRRGALFAALDAADPGDAGALLDAARLDPDGLVRGVAARAAGRIGGRDVVLTLKDRWATADEPLRSSLASAWGMAASYDAGGRDQLLWVVETSRGVPALTAAGLLKGRGGSEAEAARAAILRAVESGPTDARVSAIGYLDADDPDAQKAMEKASEDGDLRVRVAALGRLAWRKDHKQKALDDLAGYATGTSAVRNAARSAMAVAGDRRVVSLLAEDTRSAEPNVRAWAATELASMREFPDAAPVLADDDADARTRAACALLAMKR